MQSLTMALGDEPAETIASLTAYTPALDGLRAISIALVVISHDSLERYIPGGLGVTIFFAISGFLLTGQMADEISATKSLDIGRFYLRRVLRLAPTLLFYIAAISIVMGALGQWPSPLELFTALAYWANYYAIYHGYHFAAFHILWSLAVEEHFYLVAPMVLFLCRKNVGALIPAICVAMAVELAWRFHVHGACPGSPGLCGTGLDRIYYGTDTRVDSILFGSLAALAIRFGYADRFVNRPALMLACIGIALSLVIRGPLFRDTLRYSVQGACLAVVVLNVAYDRGWIAQALSWPPLVFLGKISYALYLVHFGTIMVMDRAFGHVSMPIYLAVSLGLASMVYFSIEVPMQGVRRRFKTSAVRP